MKKAITLEVTEEEEQAIRAMLKANKPKAREPKIGEDLYFVNPIADISTWPYKNDPTSAGLLEMGNWYFTYEEAKKAAARQKAITRVKNYIAENMPFEPDWNDRTQSRWAMSWAGDENRFLAVHLDYELPLVIPCVRVVGDMQKLIADCEADLRIIFGLEAK